VIDRPVHHYKGSAAAVVWRRATEDMERRKRQNVYDKLRTPVVTGKNTNILPSDELPWEVEDRNG
jgi:hypothetical protein